MSIPDEVRVVNVGLSMFAQAARAQGAAAVEVDWRIPAGGREDLVAALTRTYGVVADRIERANAEVVRRLDESAPVLRSIGAARDLIPGLDERTILHCGPPTTWQGCCDPLTRSVRAAVIAEGWAQDPRSAERLVATGEVRLEPANHHQTVLPMASAIGPSAPVFAVENPQGGTFAFSGINQGPGRTAWFGVEDPEAVERLVFLKDAVAPVLARAIELTPPVDVFSLASQGLQMGDDSHMRTQAASNLLLRTLLPALVESDHPARGDVARFLSSNHLFFLNIAMAAARSVMEWASAVEDSSAVVSLARNGTEFGLRLAATGDRWFTAPAPEVAEALFHPGFGPGDAGLDIGDSAVLELVGLGGAAAAASPAVAAFVGGSLQDAVATTERMGRISLGTSSRFRLPYLGSRGSPIGIDLRRVVELQLTPSITTGIVDATEGRGQVGAGVARAPLSCFEDALLALDASVS